MTCPFDAGPLSVTGSVVDNPDYPSQTSPTMVCGWCGRRYVFHPFSENPPVAANSDTVTTTVRSGGTIRYPGSLMPY